jgi:hypothetical protein
MLILRGLKARGCARDEILHFIQNDKDVGFVTSVQIIIQARYANPTRASMRVAPTFALLQLNVFIEDGGVPPFCDCYILAIRDGWRGMEPRGGEWCIADEQTSAEGVL